jgi:hypothetical protein
VVFDFLVSVVESVRGTGPTGEEVLLVALNAIGMAVVIMGIQTEVSLAGSAEEPRARISNAVVDVFNKSVPGFHLSGILFLLSLLMMLSELVTEPVFDLDPVMLRWLGLSINWRNVPSVLTLAGLFLITFFFIRYYILVHFVLPILNIWRAAWFRAPPSDR